VTRLFARHLLSEKGGQKGTAQKNRRVDGSKKTYTACLYFLYFFRVFRGQKAVDLALLPKALK